MDGRTIGLGIAAGIFAVAAVWLGIQNSGLNDELAGLQAELAAAQTTLEETEGKLAEAEAGAAAVPRGRPRRLPVRPKGEGVGPAGPLGPGGPGAGANRERLSEMRDQVRGQALERLVTLVQNTGTERGWDEATVDDAAAILEDSWTQTNDIRESMRNREMEPTEARTEMVKIREEANSELTELLGEAEHAALRDAMRSNNQDRQAAPQ